MQIRGPEFAAKSSLRRGAAGASPDPLLVWRFPAWPAAPRPSFPAAAGPLPHPAGLTRPPTPRGRLLAPLGREPGAAGAACPDSGRRGEPLCKERSGSPHRAGGGEFPEVAPPRGSVRGAWREQARGKEGCCLRAAGKPSLRRNPRGLGGRPVFSPPGSPPHQGKGRRGERGCHPPPPRRAAREFLPRVPGPRGSPTKRGPGILSPCQHAHHHPRACSPITDSPAAAAGIHRAYGATEEGILPRRAGVIPGRPPTLPSSPSPLPRPGRARAGNQASGSVSAALGLYLCGSGKGSHTGCEAAEHRWLKGGRRSGLRSAGGSETELVLQVLGRVQ